MVNRFQVLYLLVAAALLFGGCTIQRVPADGPVRMPTSGMQTATQTNNVAVQTSGKEIAAYTLKPLDPIYIRFSGVMDQQQLDVVIDEKGEINLLHLEQPVKAAGLTTSQLEDRIERLYVESGIYVSLSVNVTMTAKTYYIQGEVNRPGQVELTSGITLYQAIVAAGGYTPFANKKKVTITRQDQVYEKNMKEIEEDPSKDVVIEANDIIRVPQKWY